MAAGSSELRSAAKGASPSTLSTSSSESNSFAATSSPVLDFSTAVFATDFTFSILFLPETALRALSIINSAASTIRARHGSASDFIRVSAISASLLPHWLTAYLVKPSRLT